MKHIVVATSAALFLATAAQAQAEDGVRTATVSYQGLDLTNDAGIGRLKQRIRWAVNSVCKADDSSFEQKIRERSCIKASTASAGHDVARALSRANQAQASLAPTNRVAR